MVTTDITSARDLLMPNLKLMPKLSTHTLMAHTVILMASVPPLLSATNKSAPQQLPTESTNCTSVMLKLMPIQRHTTVMAVVMVMAVDTDTDTHTAMLVTDTVDTDMAADTTDKPLVNLFFDKYRPFGEETISIETLILPNYRLQRVLDLIDTMMTKVKWVAPSHSLP